MFRSESRGDQRPLNPHLQGSRAQQITAAHDVVDTHQQVIDHNSELVGEDAVRPAHHRVADLTRQVETLRAVDTVLERDYGSVTTRIRGHRISGIPFCRLAAKRIVITSQVTVDNLTFRLNIPLTAPRHRNTPRVTFTRLKPTPHLGWVVRQKPPARARIDDETVTFLGSRRRTDVGPRTETRVNQGTCSLSTLPTGHGFRRPSGTRPWLPSALPICHRFRPIARTRQSIQKQGIQRRQTLRIRRFRHVGSRRPRQR